MATSRDVQEVIAKLSSDRARVREEGVRLLSTWLEGERSIGFCKILGRNTAKIKPGEIPSVETWPFILKLLAKCIEMEISASKKRQPKIIMAKTLRAAVQSAEDPKLSGKSLHLLSVAKMLFNHIWEVIKDVSSFQSEYSSILRHLAMVKEYRYQMRKMIYCSLVVLYLKKVGISIDIKTNSLSSSKEEVFRYILTLHILLENPPGDFPDNIREDVVKGFTEIFAQVRDEGKVSRKLMDCINTYLLKDGPNLGSEAMEIHSAVKDFMFRCWLTTHDRGLKYSFIVYARIMLKLNMDRAEGSQLVAQLLDVIVKELDQSISAGSGFLWAEISRDEKAGSAGRIYEGLMELAATVFYQACKKTSKSSHKDKRLKMENASVLIKDGLMKGSWFWNGAVSFLVRNYGHRIDKTLLIYWFEATCESLERILNNANAAQSQDALLWLLRALHEFSAVLPVCVRDTSQCLPLTLSEVSLVRNHWRDIWSSLMHGLAVFRTVTSIVDLALILLGNMILQDQIGVAFVPQDVWDLRIFKHTPSLPALYFIACYFSRTGIQGDTRDVLFIRKNLLRSALELVNLKDPLLLNEQSVVLIPRAIFSLSAGSAFMTLSEGTSALLSSNDDREKLLLMEEGGQGLGSEILECSVEALAEIKPGTSIKMKAEKYHGIHLPKLISKPLVHEIMEYISGFVISNKEFDKIDLSVLIYICSLFCNIICSAILARQREETSSFFIIVLNYVSDVLNHIVSVLEDKCSEIQCHGFSSISSMFDSSGSILSSLRSLMSSPLFGLLKVNDGIDYEMLHRVIQLLEELLVVLSKLFAVLSTCANNLDGETDTEMLPMSSVKLMEESNSLVKCRMRIVDIDLDANDGSRDIDASTASGSANIVIFSSPLQWKLELVSMITTFFSVSPNHVWETLFSLMEKENDYKVHESILLNLCKYFSGPAESLSALICVMKNTLVKSPCPKFCCFHILTAIHTLLGTLLSICSDGGNAINKQSVGEVMSGENLNVLSDLLDKVSEIGLPDWFLRIELIDCISSFISLEPCSAQVMIERLLAMLQDTDYRVRLFLARKVGILFQTWDGHNELFHDICSNFGVEMVRFSREKSIKAGEVLSAGHQSELLMETALITLAHLALHSEDIEVESVFMMCTVAATEPCQRELTCALFDSLSRQLNYDSRSKYLEQLMASILARWVACEVSLVTLVEVRNIFNLNSSDAKHFVQYCCPWLLPPLVLRGDVTNLNWLSKVSCQHLSILVKDYFVPIFATCMAVHCSGSPDKEIAGTALCESLLLFAEITELERDDLIKKHMVAIVGFLLSLSSASPDPEVPYFTKDVVVLSVKTVVDGFVEMYDNSYGICIADKVNIFRPDRVFKFLVEMHYQITAASHPRHMFQRLSAFEVLIHIIGHRALVPSTSYYIMSIVGHFLLSRPLQEQCCVILSKLIDTYKTNPPKEIASVLGEQLQFLVSKLVACLIPPKHQDETAIEHSAGIVSLLHQLIVDADPSLYDYIKDLEPFPKLDCLKSIRSFQSDLCISYSPRDHFLKFVMRAPYLPQRLRLLSLETLRAKLVSGEIILRETNTVEGTRESSCSGGDPDVVSAIWTLVGLCNSTEANDMSAVLADFISRVGICNPYQVVFHLPERFYQKYPVQSSNNVCLKEPKFYTDNGVTEELLVDLIKLLRSYLLDVSVKIVDVTSQTLRGILSTEKGQNVLQCLDSHERSLIAIHSKGVNLAIVEKLVLDSGNNSSVSLEDSSLWRTEHKSYDTWVCSLVHALISHCDDTILRLCQNIVLLKAEAAELLLASVLVNLAKTDCSAVLCDLISTKVQENIFLESNDSLKSIQVLLDALNKLRSFYVAERAGLVATPLKKSRSSTSIEARCTSERSKGQKINVLLSTSFWKKVYWLSVDYLVVAKAALRCSSYFSTVMYVELWCEEHFNCLALGSPDFSHRELLPQHVDLLLAAFTQINEPDGIYGIIQSNKMTSQIIRFEHEGNWSKALEYYDLLVRSAPMKCIENISVNWSRDGSSNSFQTEERTVNWELHKGLMRSLQKTGCTHVLDVYCQSLTNRKSYLQHDSQLTDIQYEAAWRTGNWDFSFCTPDASIPCSTLDTNCCLFNENLYSCLKSLQEGDAGEFHLKLTDAKKDLVLSISNASKESTTYIHSTIIRLQMLDHLNVAWKLRWKAHPHQESKPYHRINDVFPEAVVPAMSQLESLNAEWSFILKQSQLHLDLLEPFITFRRVLLQILDCKECTEEHLLQSASTLRKGTRFSLAAAALYELKELCTQTEQQTTSHTYFLARLEEAKLLRAQGLHDMAINLGRYILEKYPKEEEISNVYRLVGKWLAETRSSNSRTILEQYLKHAVELTEVSKSVDKNFISRRCQTYFHLAHYTDGLFKSYEERLASSEWQAALRLRKHKTRELDALIKRLKSSSKGEKTDYSVKIQELQKQLTMDREEAEKLQDDRDNFLCLALEGYQQSLVIGGKYDLRVVFRLVFLWFSLSSRDHVVKAMIRTIKEVQSYKFIPLVYQIASRLGSSKDAHGSTNFQVALVSLVKKMSIDHPYHTIFQLLALANGDRVKDKQRNRSSFIVDMDKKLAAENLLNELSSHHGALIRQMKQLVEVYIKLAELETKKEETNKRIPLPREIRSLRQLELVPVITASVPVDPSCHYGEGSFPHFKGLADSIMVMNGINAPKVVECFGSDGHKYRQLAKSGNDDLRQDAVMEQFFGLVNMFLQNHRDTWKRRLRIRTYKVVPFTPSAGIVEWVNRTIPLGEYLLGSTRNGGAHGRYGMGDWSFLQCREYMASERDKRRAFLKVCEKFRPVMHNFFLERFFEPGYWFESRLSYIRSVATSSMVGYIVGLGDRHSMNILIDQDTAEVVHIDLGVAFEQGLMLKTPERVPFRLTRDTIDGMGVTGVEGVFRRCCEETLSVMRTNKEALLTIIEVFIHDPLYKWALSPLKALQRQKETDDEIESCLGSSQDSYEGNKDAARATLRVKQKLDGYEEGEMRSVQGQVQQLIQDAVDIDRLCQMFPGWGAWL
ncbi:serine/threonine-protein kinase ATM isoform X2 [Typha angustifolia]|uniref:serine/threonine-protein kinase ATM isoform X2 n=1 Tax=Typha angustifolia TaxID=59011 RepID=UPI003C308986